MSDVQKGFKNLSFFRCETGKKCRLSMQIKLGYKTLHTIFLIPKSSFEIWIGVPCTNAIMLRKSDFHPGVNDMLKMTSNP